MLGRGLAVAAAVAIFDQASKGALSLAFHEGGCGKHQQTITSFLDLVLTCNTGISFGILNRTGGVSAMIFSLAAAVVIIVLVLWLQRVRATFLAVAIGMIIGGAAGNVIDRLRFGGGGCFLYFHLGPWHWPGVQLPVRAI